MIDLRKSTDEQVVLYSKGQYGRSEDAMADLKVIVCKYCALPSISDREILGLVSRTFTKCIPHLSGATVGDAITELAGGGFRFMERTPLQTMLGTMSITEISRVMIDTDNLLDEVRFGAKIRIFHLANELGKKSKDLIDVAEILGIDAKNHMTSLTREEAKRIRSYVENEMVF